MITELKNRRHGFATGVRQERGERIAGPNEAALDFPLAIRRLFGGDSPPGAGFAVRLEKP
jgi:hypothetical protein